MREPEGSYATPWAPERVHPPGPLAPLRPLPSSLARRGGPFPSSRPCPLPAQVGAMVEVEVCRPLHLVITPYSYLPRSN